MDYLYRYMQCISTHALTEGDRRIQSQFCAVPISTHALTEGDLLRCELAVQLCNISTHALTEGDRYAFSIPG